MTDRGDPHFLHKARALEALLSPQLEAPRAITWLPKGDVLLVACIDGTVAFVEPSFGTRTLLTAHAEPVDLAVDGDDLAVLCRDGTVQVWDWRAPALKWEQPTGLVSQLQVTWFKGGVAACGDDLEDRRAFVFDRAGKRRARARLHARTVLGADVYGTLVAARSTTEGLQVVPFGKPFPNAEPTKHALRIGTGGVFGVATGGLTVWRDPEHPPVNVKMYDVSTAALAPDGEHVALGTRNGGVALAWAVAGKEQRVHPAQVEGHEAPVIALAFSPKGRWLASVADRCRVWSW